MTESPWPLHFKHSHRWKRRSWSNFLSHYAWGTNAVCKFKMDVKSTWIPTWHRMDHVSWSLGLFSTTTSQRQVSHKTRRPRHSEILTIVDFILFYHVWGPAWIEIHWNNSWLRAWSHMTSHYTRGSATPLHDVGGVWGGPVDTFFWALTISFHGHGSWLVCGVALTLVLSANDKALERGSFNGALEVLWVRNS